MIVATTVNPPKESPEAAPTPRRGLIECGRASEQTRGMKNLPQFELGVPPYDRTFVGEEELS